MLLAMTDDNCVWIDAVQEFVLAAMTADNCVWIDGVQKFCARCHDKR